MEKIKFIDPDTSEEIELFVVEETKVNEVKYLFVAEEEEGDCSAFILKETKAGPDEIVYDVVEEDEELAAIGKVFAELIDDADIEY